MFAVQTCVVHATCFMPKPNIMSKLPFTINAGGRLLSLERPVVMGIVNVTPDSFYGGSRVGDDELLSRCRAMIEHPFSSLPFTASFSPSLSLHTLPPSLPLVIFDLCALLLGFSNLCAAWGSLQAAAWAEQSPAPLPSSPTPHSVSQFPFVSFPAPLFVSLCLSLAQD